MDEELLLDLMIEMEYNSLINYKNSSKHLRNLYNVHKNYIYKKKLMNIHCIQDLQDVYLIIEGKATRGEICLKNQKHDTTIDCNDPGFIAKLSKLFIGSEQGDITGITAAFDVIRVLIKCFDNTNSITQEIFWSEEFLKVLYIKIATENAMIDLNNTSRNVQKAWSIFYSEQVIHLKEKIWNRLNSLYPCNERKRSRVTAECT
jgi:hypothetical protein